MQNKLEKRNDLQHVCNLWKIYPRRFINTNLKYSNMAIKAAIILVSISIILLSVYGADVAVLHLSDDKVGFLPFDHMIRGIGLGMPALILPFISFIIARKNVSKILGVLLILIIAGGIVILGMAPE